MNNDSSVNDAHVVLSYYDSLLRQADVNLLKGPYWLNDVIIGFYFEYLEQKSKQIKFVSPGLTQLLKMMEPHEYSAILDDTINESTNYIFFPLNNCDKVDEVGGSHWSLLVYSKADVTCRHYDSSSGMNKSIAKSFAKKIMNYLLTDEIYNFTEVKCPQQDNSYDCGIFVLANAENLLNELEHGNKIAECKLNDVKSEVITLRTSILHLIDVLSNKK